MTDLDLQMGVLAKANPQEARAAWDLHREALTTEHDARQPQDELWPRREFDALPTHEDDVLVAET